MKEEVEEDLGLVLLQELVGREGEGEGGW